MKPVYKTSNGVTSAARNTEAQIPRSDLTVFRGYTRLNQAFDVSLDGGVTWSQQEAAQSVRVQIDRPVRIRSRDSAIRIEYELNTLSSFAGDGAAKLPVVIDKAGASGVSSAAMPTTSRIYGSSTFFGTGASSTARRCSTRMSLAARMTETNAAVGGAVLHLPNEAGNPAGYATILQNYAPAREAGPWMSDLGLALIGFNHNDLTALAPTSEGLRPFKTALATVIDRCQASAVFEDTHASVTYGSTSASTWATFTNTARNSGAGYHYTETGDGAEWLQIAVPASFDGTDIVIGLIAGVVSGVNVPLQFLVDGQPFTPLQFFPPNITTGRIGYTYRLRGLAPGAHTIRINAIPYPGGTNVAFDYWSIEARNKPIVVVPSAYRRVDGGFTDAQIDALSTAIRDVVAMYDANVQVADLDAAIDKNARLFISDRLHPTDEGHALISEALMDAARRGAANVNVSALV